MWCTSTSFKRMELALMKSFADNNNVLGVLSQIDMVCFLRDKMPETIRYGDVRENENS